ncbi:MAG: hypothetical protein M1816_003779 [Peltula sp. TS41687]|nr:MAG: hypothetical protein M1816_003779 [Peltula sp. TS41687]
MVSIILVSLVSLALGRQQSTLRLRPASRRKVAEWRSRDEAAKEQMFYYLEDDNTAATASRFTFVRSMASTLLDQNQSSFSRALMNFTNTLSEERKDDFRFSTLADLHSTIHEIQRKQASVKKMRNMARLSSFLEAMEQYGKVIEVFLNTSEFVAFIWGPVKFLLQVASSYAEAFDALLDAYEQIGENIPLLSQYQSLFERNPQMRKVLEMIYADILEFHRKAIKYFQQKVWKQVFQATWKTFRTEFSGLFMNLQRHGRLLENHANLIQFEQLYQELQIQRTAAEAEICRNKAGEEGQRRLSVWSWLSAARSESDQEKGVDTRKDYPDSGRWLLRSNLMQAWLNPEFCSTPLLWVNGIPGAGNHLIGTAKDWLLTYITLGKTVLASLVIEECQRLSKRHPSSVAYFYCKHNDPKRNNFVAVVRGMLVQILHQNGSLLPYLYEKASSSGERVLESSALAEEILEVALKSLENVYTIIDGLDECDNNEKKRIIMWFRKIIDLRPETESESLRCLFFSQDDGVIGKLLARIPVIPISSEDTKEDIQRYTAAWSQKIQGKFGLPDDRCDRITETVVEIAKGMFLYAKLVMENLQSQTKRANLERELEPNTFPRGLEDAYARIVGRILKDPSVKDDAARLLGWLVCAKRPMKWPEIQGAMSINLEAKDVDFEGRQLLVDWKDLCGSLVERRSDDSVELVHLTARFFLLDQKHINLVSKELEMTRLCIGYLNFRCFDDLDESDVNTFIRAGWYSFLDYAAIHWVDHIKQWTCVAPVNDSITEVAESLPNFLQRYWSEIIPSRSISKEKEEKIKTKFSRFETCGFFNQLMIAVSTWEKQTNTFNRSALIAGSLTLIDRISKVRSALENMASCSLRDEQLARALRTFYGSNLFKCSSVSCRFFHEGFTVKEQRNRHTAKHSRAFICTYARCPYETTGFDTRAKLTRHSVDCHEAAQGDIWRFPVIQDPKSINIKQAVSKGSIDEIEKWLEQFDAKPCFQDLRRSAFEPTIQKGDEAIMRLLLHSVQDISEHNISLLCHKALKSGQNAIASLLLDHPMADFYKPADPYFPSPFYNAIRYGRFHIVKHIIENQRFDAERVIESKSGRTPLSLAAKQGHEAIVKLLTDRNDVDVNSKGSSGTTPLSLAAWQGHEAVVKLLIDRNDIDVNSKNNMSGKTPLSLAAEGGYKSLVKLLIDRNDIDVNSKNNWGKTSLLVAAKQGHEAVVKLLIDRNDIDVNSKDKWDNTPLSLAAWQGHEAVVKLLADRNDVDVNSKDNSGRTPLSMAAQQGHEAIVKLLTDRNDVDVNSKDGSGRTPLSLAAWQGHEAVVKLLTDRNDVDVNSKDNSGTTPLILAAQQGHEAVVKLLADRNDVDVNSKDGSGSTPLSLAAWQGHEAVVKLLTDRNDVDVNSKNNWDNTPLSLAAWQGHEAIVKLLADRNDVDVNSKDNWDNTPLSLAAQQGHEAIVKLLTDRNDVDVNSKDNCDNTPLSLAAWQGHEAVVKLLTDRNDVDVNSKDGSGRTPLSLAAWQGHEAIVKLLADRNDVDVNSKDNWDNTPLSMAAQQGHEAIVKLLTDRNDVDVNSKDNCDNTPLSLAAWQGHEAVVKLLTDRNDVDVNSKDNCDNTPLSLAAWQGHEAVVKLLTNRNDVDVNSKDSSGTTPLILAAWQGHEAVVKLLADRNDVDVNSKNNWDNTPLSMAARQGHEAVVKLLTDRNDVDVNSKDYSGRTPFILAAQPSRATRQVGM